MANGDPEEKQQPYDPAARQPLFYENKTLTIYCPADIADEFINLAKREFYDKQYIAMKELLRSWKEARQLAYLNAEMEALREEIIELNKRIDDLEPKKDDGRTHIVTMGGELKDGDG